METQKERFAGQALAHPQRLWWLVLRSRPVGELVTLPRSSYVDVDFLQPLEAIERQYSFEVRRVIFSRFCNLSVSCLSYGTLLSQHGESAMLERVDVVHNTLVGAVAFAQQGEGYHHYPNSALLCL